MAGQHSIKLVAALGMGLLLSACSKYEELSLNNAVADYKMTCFASLTNECVAKRAEVNIQTAELYISKLKQERDAVVSAYNVSVYEDVIKMLNAYIEYNEDNMPGFFARNFMGEARIWEPTKVGELDLAPWVVKSWMNELAAREEANGHLLGQNNAGLQMQAETVSMESTITVSDDSGETTGTIVPEFNDPNVEALINGHIKSLESYENGYEYREGRQNLLADFDGDQQDDIAVLFTLEGAEGSNRYESRLSVFLSNSSGYSLLESIYVPKNSNLKSYEGGILSLDVLDYADGDANCCPSLEREQQYMINGNGIFEKR